jgi:hypothetical protein
MGVAVAPDDVPPDHRCPFAEAGVVGAVEGELAVMPSQVVDSTDGGLPPESGVAAVMIVEMQE